MATKIDIRNIEWYLQNKDDITIEGITEYFGTEVIEVLKDMENQGKIEIIEDFVFLNQEKSK